MAEVSYDHLLVNQLWTRVCAIGQLRPSSLSIQSDSSERRPILVLVIPGNPGVCDLYEEFCSQVYESLTQSQPDRLTSVWCVSHAGHAVLPGEFAAPAGPILLHQQIDHKVDFIRQSVPISVPLCLVGHSIGAHMIVEMLDRLKDDGYTVGHSSLLFPTVERMVESPAGCKVAMAKRWHLVGPLMLVAFLLCRTLFAFDSVKHAYLSLTYGDTLEKCVRRGIVAHMFNYDVLTQVTSMGLDEMDKVRSPNLVAIRRHLANLHLYYGADDHWVPLEFYETMRAALGNRPNLILCEEGVEHAFVLTSTLTMARKVAGWITEAV